MGSDKLRFAYWYAKWYLRQHELQDHKGKVTKKRRDVKLTDDTLKQMIDFHKQLVEKGVPKFAISTYEQFKIIKVNGQLREILPQFRTMDGTHNLWIVKPSYTARGLGIYCTRAMKDIIPDKKP